MRKTILFLLVASAAFCQDETISASFRKTAGGGGGPSAFAYVASSVTGCYNLNSTQTKCVYALHVNPSAGSLIFCEAGWVDSGNTITATLTSSNNTWTAQTRQNDSTNGTSGENFVVLSANAGADTITLTLSASESGFVGFECTQYTYTGTMTTLDPDNSTGNKIASVVASSTGSITGTASTTGSSDLIVASCNTSVSACTSAGTGYTGRNDLAGACNYNGTSCASTNNDYGTTTGALLEDKVNVTAGSQTATFNTGSSDHIIIGIAQFGK